MNLTGLFVTLGIMVGIAVGMILLSISNKNGKVKTDYDERQEAIRGRGYKYGMYSAWIMLGIYCVCGISEIDVHMETSIAAFIILAVSVIVQFTYAVFNDAYFGKNSDIKRYCIIFGIVGIIDIIGAVGYYKDGLLIENGVLTWRCTSAVVSLMMVILFAELIIKRMLDKKEEAEEE